MDRDPIFETSFWKERLAEARRRGHLHYSVYLAHPGLWEKIIAAHEVLLKKYIPKKAKVLDAACGYGRLSPMFDNYTGVDFSPDLLEVGREMFPDKKFVQADLRKLPFEDGEFDWAICASVKHMIIGRKGLEAWAECEKEIKRVAKKVLIIEYEAGATKDFKHEIL